MQYKKRKEGGRNRKWGKKGSDFAKGAASVKICAYDGRQNNSALANLEKSSDAKPRN